MENIKSIAGISKAIQLLEIEQAEKGQLLREQFNLTYESLKPVNILKNTIKEVSSSPYLAGSIIGTASGLATGFLSKTIVVGKSANIFRRLIGTILQFSITNVVARHPDKIRSLRHNIFNRLFHKKEVKTGISSKALLSSNTSQLLA